MQVRIRKLIEGAKQAQGLTVIIDVFRAFTLEAYLFDQGAERIYPIGSLDDAFALKQEHPDWVLFGERGGAKVEGCDWGNSPSATAGIDFTGKTLIHSTSAGTQGIVNAVNATEIVTASLVNARAVAEYIRSQNPEIVTICAMGKAGLVPTEEDDLCAEYLKALLEGEPFDVQTKADALRYGGGAQFFDPDNQSVFPEADFPMCIDCDRFDFVIHVGRDEQGRRITTASRD